MLKAVVIIVLLGLAYFGSQLLDEKRQKKVAIGTIIALLVAIGYLVATELIR